MTRLAPALTIGGANQPDGEREIMEVIAVLRENASIIAALFSVIGVAIGYANYRVNMAQSAFQMGTTPIFEPGAEPVDGHPGWWRITIVIRNRATSALVVKGISVPRWRRYQLAPMPDDGSTPTFPAAEAGRHIDVSAEVLPRDRTIELMGRTWRSDTSTIVFFLYCPRRPCPMRIIWRSKSSTRLCRSKVVV